MAIIPGNKSDNSMEGNNLFGTLVLKDDRVPKKVLNLQPEGYPKLVDLNSYGMMIPMKI